MNDNNYNDFDDETFEEESFDDENSFDDDNSFDNSSSNKSKMATWIIVGIVALVTFVLVFALTNKLINGNKKKTVTPEPVKVEKYDAYKVGDTVTLKDGSNWHVLYESKDTSEYLSLLNDDDVNKDGILYGNVNSFLKGTYKTELVKNLGCQSTDIQEVRLFAYLDLADISKASSSEFLPDTALSKFNFPDWVSLKTTVTDTVYQTDTSNSPVMICTKGISDELKAKDQNGAVPQTPAVSAETEEDSGATFCLGDNTVALPVRPVIVISKKILKSETTTNTTDTSTTNTTN